MDKGTTLVMWNDELYMIQIYNHPAQQVNVSQESRDVLVLHRRVRCGNHRGRGRVDQCRARCFGGAQTPSLHHLCLGSAITFRIIKILKPVL